MTQPTIEEMIEWMGLKDGELWASDDDEKMFQHVCAALTAQALPEAQTADAKRLDYLDARNAAKNLRHGTKYGWQLSENCNRIALEDHGWPPLDVRGAIDAAIAAAEDGAG